MHLFVMFVTIILCSDSAFSTIAPGTKNGCKFENGTRYCCSGYYEENNECHECIGAYGLSCTDSCPSGWFGKVCMYQCTTCSAEECDVKVGCPGSLPQQLALYTNPESNKENKSSILQNKIIGSSQKLYLPFSTSNPSHRNSSISEDLSSPENATDTSLWQDMKELIGTLQTRDWVIVSLAGVLLIVFIVIGAKKCTKKKEKKKLYEEQNGYCKSTQRFSGDYSCITENEYTEISTMKTMSADSKN